MIRFIMVLSHLNWKMADEEFAKNDELLILGGNRSGKSEYASKRVIKCINDIREANVLCMHTTARLTSIEQQQQYIWKYIPVEWKAAKKGKITNMTFSKKGGFTESCCVAPNSSRIFFGIIRKTLIVGYLRDQNGIWYGYGRTLRFRPCAGTSFPARNEGQETCLQRKASGMDGWVPLARYVNHIYTCQFILLPSEYLQGATTERWGFGPMKTCLKRNGYRLFSSL